MKTNNELVVNQVSDSLPGKRLNYIQVTPGESLITLMLGQRGILWNITSALIYFVGRVKNLSNANLIKYNDIN